VFGHRFYGKKDNSFTLHRRELFKPFARVWLSSFYGWVDPWKRYYWLSCLLRAVPIMFTDILTVGPSLPADGGNVSMTGANFNTHDNVVYEITPETSGSKCINEAIDNAVSDAGGAAVDIYIHPSSTGKYIFYQGAGLTVPARIHWPAGTYAENSTGNAEMLGFTKPNSALFNFYAKTQISANNAHLVYVADAGVKDGTPNFIMTGCHFDVEAASGSSTLQDCSCVYLHGKDSQDDTITGLGNTILTTGAYIAGNTFEFGDNQQQIKNIGASGEKYGIMGIRVKNRRHVRIIGNNFKGNTAALISINPKMGYCHNAIYLDNAIFSNVIGNVFYGLSTAGSDLSTGGIEYASDLIHITETSGVEGHHSHYGYNFVEWVVARYVWNFDEAVFFNASNNTVGRIYSCAAACRVKGNQGIITNWDMHNVSKGATPYHVQPTYFKGEHFLWDGASNIVTGGHMFGVKPSTWDASIGFYSYGSSQGIQNLVNVPYSMTPAYLNSDSI
jgi:hypothetical protein